VTLAGIGALVWANTEEAKNREATTQATRLMGIAIAIIISLVFIWPQIKSATSKSVLMLFFVARRTGLTVFIRELEDYR
jgi:hypothetical protein